MRTAEIAVGKIYYDGKDSLRKVVQVTIETKEVLYLLLAARQEQEWDDNSKSMISTIGREIACKLESFAAWAKKSYTNDQGLALLLELKAKKIKVAPGEKAFLHAVLATTGNVLSDNTRVSFASADSRAVAGLERKGVLLRENGEAEFTDLGTTFLRLCLAGN